MASGINDNQRAVGADNKALNRGTTGPNKAKADAGTGSVPADVYSELGKMVPAEPDKKKNSIEIDQRDLSIGRARYEGATHITKNLALVPHADGRGSDLSNHTSIEVHLYDDKGKEQPMKRRYFRDWAWYPADPNKRIATLRKGDALTPMPGTTKRFLWETGGTTDAPGQQNITQDKRTYVYLQEFVAGSPETGGYYYQVVIMLDPDATSRVQVRNTIPLTPRDYQDLLKIMNDPNFERDYAGKFLIDNLPNTVQSDTGVDRTVPNLVEQKKQKKAK